VLRGRILSHSGARVSGDAGIGGAAEKIPARRMGCQRCRVPSSAVIADEPERGDRRIPPPAHRDTTGGRSLEVSCGADLQEGRETRAQCRQPLVGLIRGGRAEDQVQEGMPSQRHELA
jgi:hypothetical protein